MEIRTLWQLFVQAFVTEKSLVFPFLILAIAFVTEKSLVSPFLILVIASVFMSLMISMYNLCIPFYLSAHQSLAPRTLCSVWAVSFCLISFYWLPEQEDSPLRLCQVSHLPHCLILIISYNNNHTMLDPHQLMPCLVLKLDPNVQFWAMY